MTSEGTATPTNQLRRARPRLFLPSPPRTAAMKTMKGPGIFLAQFAGDAAPFNSLDTICGWAASLGYKGVQVSTWDARLFDLAQAATSSAYCDEVKGTAARHGI